MAKLTFGKYLLISMIAFAFTALQSPPSFSTEMKVGEAEYESKCATCHGKDGAGDGPVAPALRKRPPDLRLLTKNNDGVFPAEVLRNIVDGRRSLRAHGSYEMPVWGRETSRDGSSVDTSNWIPAIVEYLESMQLK